MKSFQLLVVAVSLLSQYASGFAPPANKCERSSSALHMGFDLNRFSRSQRSAGVDDRVVELRRPLGLVLDEDGNGNVVVETVAPRGNAARTGLVRRLSRIHSQYPQPNYI
jgi:hypothetical protein